MNKYEGITKPLMWSMALLLAATLTGCGSGSLDPILGGTGAGAGAGSGSASPVALGKAFPFGIAATAGVTNTGTAPNTTIYGSVVLDPTAQCNTVAVDAAGGFGLCGGFAPTLIGGSVISPLYPDAGVTSGAIKADLRAAVG